MFKKIKTTSFIVVFLMLVLSQTAQADEISELKEQMNAMQEQSKRQIEALQQQMQAMQKQNQEQLQVMQKKIEEIEQAEQTPAATADASVPANIKDRVAVLEEKVEKGSKWLEKIKQKGDLRLRNELKTKPQGGDNNRQRLRFRWGLVAEVNDQTEVGFGFATGSSDSPLSTNQTLEQTFQSKSVWIDYAYAKYKANDTFTFIGGKFKRPYFDTSMFWDGDVRMDGFAIKANHSLLEGGDWPETKGFATIGFFPLDDAPAGTADLYLTAEEVGIESKFDDFAKLKTGVIFYNFHGAEGYLPSDLAESQGTNTTEAFGGARLANDFQIVNPTVKLTFNDLLDLGIPVTLFYEYAKNVGAEPDDDNQAWSSGIQINKGGFNQGDWKFKIKYLL